MQLNHKPSEIMAKAEKKAAAFYPEGTVIDVRFRDDWRIDQCEVISSFEGTFRVKSVVTGKVHNFYPGLHPHMIVRKAK